MLFESVEDVDRFEVLRDIDHPVLSGRVHSNLHDARADRRHRLGMLERQAHLSSEELLTCTTPGSAGKRAQVASRGADPGERLPMLEIYNV